jgi:MSHA biogenesis protein MshL
MKKTFLAAGLCFLILSCAHTEKTKETVQPVSRPVDIPSPVVSQVEKEKTGPYGEQAETFSFSLRDAEVKDVLRGLAKQTHHNIVVEPDVKGLCTVDLKNVTILKALEYILEPLNFTFRVDGRTVYVSKPKFETKVFSLNYLALKKTGTSTVMATQTGSGASSTSTAGGVTTTSSSGTTDKAVSVTSETQSDIWKNLEDNLKNILSADGKYIVNQQALMVIVTDYPRFLKNVALFFDAIQGVVHRQVMIEAKIVEVTLSDASREGVNWKFIDGKIGEYVISWNQALLNPKPLISDSPTALSSLPYFRFYLGGKHFDAENTFIDLLKTQGTLKIISSPKVATMNNQRAVIKVARQDVYFEEQQSTTGGSGNGAGLATYTPRFITIGLVLDVTPQIDDAGNILLNMHPMLTEKVGSVKSPSGNEVPVLDVREADAMVRVRDGETVIIGGLMKDTTITTDRGVPGLMNMPFVGTFFKVHVEEIVKTELVIFLTPRVVYDRGMAAK